MIFGLALIMGAFVILGHDCQAWFERGVWSSTSISGVLDLLQVDDDLMDQLRRIDFIHSILQLPFYWVSIGVGYAASAFGAIFDANAG